jgi:hypothetical protein
LIERNFIAFATECVDRGVTWKVAAARYGVVAKKFWAKGLPSKGVLLSFSNHRPNLFEFGGCLNSLRTGFVSAP